ncbi:MAG: SRPBCC family protein [Opitutales bacterium]
MKKTEQVYTTYIRTTPKKLWAAITTPEFCHQYWGGGENHSTWKKGAKWEHVFPDESEKPMIVGKVLECRPPRRLVLSWVAADDPKNTSRVSFAIEKIGSMVCLTVVHGRFMAGSTMPGKVGRGWPRVLSSLKSFLETGQGLDVWAGRK